MLGRARRRPWRRARPPVRRRPETTVWPRPPVARTGLRRTGPRSSRRRPARRASAGREGGEAAEDGVAQAAAHLGGPAGRGARVRRDERVGDRLGGDEGVGHDAAEQVVLAADAERPRRLEPDERVAGHEVDRAGGAACTGVVVAGEVEALEGREPLGDAGAGRLFVALREFAPAERQRDDGSARCGAPRSIRLRRRRGSRGRSWMHHRVTMCDHATIARPAGGVSCHQAKMAAAEHPQVPPYREPVSARSCAARKARRSLATPMRNCPSSHSLMPCSPRVREGSDCADGERRQPDREAAAEFGGVVDDARHRLRHRAGARCPASGCQEEHCEEGGGAEHLPWRVLPRPSTLSGLGMTLPSCGRQAEHRPEARRRAVGVGVLQDAVRRHAGPPPPAPARGRGPIPAWRATRRRGRSAARAFPVGGRHPGAVVLHHHLDAGAGRGVAVRRRRRRAAARRRAGVNLMALSSRFATACRSRSRSPDDLQLAPAVRSPGAARAPRRRLRRSRRHRPAPAPGRRWRRRRGGRRPRPRRCAAGRGRCGRCRRGRRCPAPPPRAAPRPPAWPGGRRRRALPPAWRGRGRSACGGRARWRRTRRARRPSGSRCGRAWCSWSPPSRSNSSLRPDERDARGQVAAGDGGGGGEGGPHPRLHRPAHQPGAEEGQGNGDAEVDSTPSVRSCWRRRRSVSSRPISRRSSGSSTL